MSADPYQKLDAPLDRFQEAHFWIHMMEKHYHAADPFRWHLNAFLKALKEVPQLTEMAVQNEKGFKVWFKDHKVRLREDPLIAALFRNRDLVVHRGMLVPESTGTLGITEGRGIKLGMSLPLHPLEDSDVAMERYLRVAKSNDFLGILGEDEDSMPCVEREWRLEGFDEETVDLCARAWLRLEETLAEVLKWLGVAPPPLSLDCRHSSQRVRFKLYDRKKLTTWMAGIDAAPGSKTEP